MIKKWFIYFSRDKTSLSCEILIPIVLLFIGFGFTNMKFISDPPSIYMNYKTYPFEFPININTGSQSILDNIQPSIYKTNKYYT